jgi:hypothetical protein
MIFMFDEKYGYGVPLYQPPISANMPLEDVIKYYAQQESERTEDTRPRNKASMKPHIRIAPEELISSLDLITNKISKISKITTQNVLTKCIALHLLCWYTEILKLDKLSEEFQILFEEAKRGHTSIRKQLETANFQFYKAPEKVDTHLEIATFVIGSLAVWSTSLGASPLQLLVEGIAWSLTTLENRQWDEYNIPHHFMPEVRHMEKMVKFRRIELAGFRQKLEIDN